VTLIGVSVASSVKRWLDRFRADCRANDMVEYGLLSLLFGIIGVVVWNQIGTDIQTALVNWDAGMQGLWEVPNPAGS
jgi:Flp pilus assembly pilin Flp